MQKGSWSEFGSRWMAFTKSAIFHKEKKANILKVSCKGILPFLLVLHKEKRESFNFKSIIIVVVVAAAILPLSIGQSLIFPGNFLGDSATD